MSDRPAVITGSLVDAKNVHTHKSLRLIIDVPAEHAQRVFEAFGWPTMANPVSVAVARLSETAEQRSNHSAQGEADRFRVSEGSRPASASPALDRRPVALAGRVKLACDRSDFYDWLRRESAYEDIVLEEMEALAPHGGSVSFQAISEAAVKRLCGVERKRDILPGTPAAERWQDIWFQFTHSGQGRAA